MFLSPQMIWKTYVFRSITRTVFLKIRLYSRGKFLLRGVTMTSNCFLTTSQKFVCTNWYLLYCYENKLANQRRVLLIRIQSNFDEQSWAELSHQSNGQVVFMGRNQGRTKVGWAGGGFRMPPAQRFDPLPTQRVPPLVLFKKSIFGRLTLKVF